MNKIDVFNTDEIKKAVAEVKKIKPDFALIFDLYEKIFIAQEESKQGINLQEFILSDEIVSLKKKEKFPLVEIRQFQVDVDVSRELFLKLCTILVESANELTDRVKDIMALVDDRKIDTAALFTAFMNGDESAFDKAEENYEIDKSILGFLVYNSIKPSLVVFSVRISQYLEKETVWEKGYCPVCGSAPELSVFEENGKRSLVCSFCNHKWLSKRIYCPFCENTDHETLKYYNVGDEEEYRIDACEKCKKYIKTIDTKKTSRTIYLPLENQTTPYVEIKFNKLGYRSGCSQGDISESE